MDKARLWLNQLLTGLDNKTPDIGRVGPFISIVAGTLLAGWAVIFNKQTFAPLEFFGGCALLWTGSGIGLGAKKDTEPKE
jgi:hypothetical protein